MSAARPAGFWIRALAALLDLLLIGLVHRSFGRIAGAGPEAGFAPGLHTVLFASLYTILLHAYAGQTLGKLVAGVRVVGADGEPPALRVAALRFLCYFVSLATFGLGFAMAGLRQDRRALHDLLAGTRVERVPRRRAAVEELPGDPHPAAPTAGPSG